MKILAPQAPDPNHLRYTDFEFPPYRFIPGVNAHPQRDPEGHSYNKEHAPVIYSPPEDWQSNANYLFGVDLYNHAYWWEAHEAWEELWHTTKKSAAYGQFLQGLIQVSAAFIKWQSQQQVGMEKLFGIGLSRLEFVLASLPAGQTQFMGLDLKTHRQKIKNHFEVVVRETETWPDPLLEYPFIELKING